MPSFYSVSVLCARKQAFVCVGHNALPSLSSPLGATSSFLRPSRRKAQGWPSRVTVPAMAGRPLLEDSAGKEQEIVSEAVREGLPVAVPDAAPKGKPAVIFNNWVDDRRSWVQAAGSLLTGTNDGSKQRLIKSSLDMFRLLEKVGVKNVKFIDENTGNFTPTGWAALLISLSFAVADVSFAVVTVNGMFKLAADLLFHSDHSPG
jgi:hypothetical protein